MYCERREKRGRSRIWVKWFSQCLDWYLATSLHPVNKYTFICLSARSPVQGLFPFTTVHGTSQFRLPPSVWTFPSSLFTTVIVQRRPIQCFLFLLLHLHTPLYTSKLYMQCYVPADELSGLPGLCCLTKDSMTAPIAPIPLKHCCIIILCHSIQAMARVHIHL